MSLVELGADLNARNARGWTALHHMAAIGHMNAQAVEMAELLLEKGADPTLSEPDTGFTPLDRARDNGSEQVVALLKAAQSR